MNRKTFLSKPEFDRYYLNLRTGQVCHIKGSPIAINRILNKEWPRMKILTKRIPKREWEKHTPETPIFGYDHRYKQFHKFSQTYYPL
jgi:hypothetical protein